MDRGGNNDQHRQRRNGQNNVGGGANDRVDGSAEVARGEAQHGSDQESHSAGQQTYLERQRHTRDQDRQLLSAGAVSAKWVVRRWRQVWRCGDRDCLGCANRRNTDKPEQQHAADERESNSDPRILA